jgi:hypothetical protein
MSKKKINRIFLLGDSWIEGQGTYSVIHDDGILDEPSLPFDNTGDGGISGWRKENSWNKFFREEYGDTVDIINLGRQGADNQTSFNKLNYILSYDYQETDLILFGFTSKYRDTHINYSFKKENMLDWRADTERKKLGRNHNEYSFLLHEKNPLANAKDWPLSFERLQVAQQLLKKNNDENVFLGKEEFYESDKISEDEKEFSRKWLQDFFVEIFDERVYENIAATNYIFYQKYCKWKGINILFFDLFEPYVNSKFTNEFYNVDTEMYINYGKKHFRDILVDYEFENYSFDAPYSVWECGHTFPSLNSNHWYKKGEKYSGLIYHPNQHGYKVIFDYLVKNHISKNYKITIPPLI